MTAVTTPDTPFSCIILGDQSLTIACADMIVSAGHRVVAIVSTDADVCGWAASQGIRVLEKPADVTGSTVGPFDWLLSIANLRIIPQSVLKLPGKGAVNFHDGPLPRYAGLNTPAWAIINGETQHGVSWHMIEGGVDEGDLLAQELVDIAPDETAFSLNSKCYAAGMESFAGVLAQLEQGTPARSPQDLTQRSYFSRDQRPAPFGMIDFSASTAAITALLRGLDFGGYWNPLGVGKISHAQGVSTVAAGASAQGSGAAGTVLDVGNGTLVVATADGAVSLTGVAGAPLPPAGTVLDPIDPAMVQAQQEVLRDEPFWRARLGVMDPLP
jgi:methionyl-tRNA formyltransferase